MTQLFGRDRCQRLECDCRRDQAIGESDNRSKPLATLMKGSRLV